ncbi:MAG: hypothetical protein AB4372_15920 [Xenococcus sp. (in: cyanobacteria)]
MLSSFQSILKDVIPEANFLTISDTRMVPGAMLRSKEDDMWTDTIETVLVPKFFQKEDFQTKLIPGELDLTSASGSFSGGAALSLLGILNLKVSGGSDFNVNITVEGVQERNYQSENMGSIAFEKALRSLKEKDKDTFKLLKGRFLVFTSYYASKFRLEFQSESHLDKAEVRFKNESIAANASAKMKKESNAVLVSNNNAVPFAVSGFRISGGGSTILDQV